ASEIYRHYRQGRNVVAVTSAQGDQTDVLMAEARRIGPEGIAQNLPELIQLGERKSAALLALALERTGASAFVRQARDIGLQARGPHTQAELVDLNVAQLQEDLKNHDIVVMPGFVGIGKNDRPSLLGDGGADYTALYVAQRLNAPALLLKDVDGVYESDPKDADDSPGRYQTISWTEARQRTDVLISPKALNFAEDKGVEFFIGRPGIPFYTRVGAVMGAPSTSPVPRKLRVAMMGCGVVGGGVYRRIMANPDRFDLVSILVRNPQKYINQGYPADRVTTDYDACVAARPDIFIDVSGPVEPALTYIRDMLDRGVHIVSANKQAIAEGGRDLLKRAGDRDVMLAFSSAAGGGMPILEMCRREKGRIVRIEALLNGTTNYMIDEICNGKTYAEALEAAQEKGFAEADPSNDVSGRDAAAKIRLLARLAFDIDVGFDRIPCDTIENFNPPEANKCVIKRVSVCHDHAHGFDASVELRNLCPDDFLAGARGEEARATVYFTDGDAYRIRGKGAGRWPTTEAVMADLYDISERVAFRTCNLKASPVL
ncbi:MAG: homoserine dehydrogenase, partial [Hyphomonadaceae bacterium]|nr:homoserine dehydrogenase [Hyphomonadaceae bacterium]